MLHKILLAHETELVIFKEGDQILLRMVDVDNLTEGYIDIEDLDELIALLIHLQSRLNLPTKEA